jgi:two-component system NtrC family sensor kinase
VIVLAEIVILGLLTYATIRVQESNLMENVLLSATRVSDLIARSTRYSMLQNRREDVHGIIASVGGLQGIEGIRIYNKQGEIVFGTAPGELRTKVDLNAEACIICHTSSGLEHPHPTTEALTRIFTAPGGERVLGLITPIRNEQLCSDADCHAHPENKTILGVLDVKMSLASIDRRISDHRTTLLWLSAVAALLIGTLSGGFIWLVVRRPVRRLMAGMELVSMGNLDHKLAVDALDELGQLATSFNAMIEELAKARSEITTWSQTLEAKVLQKTSDLERAHLQMVKVEKMASLGNLASSVAHELNNPLEGILTFARLLIKRLRKTALPADVIESYCGDLKLVADEAQRCGNIVKNLLIFARQRGIAFEETHLNPLIERCILLVNHHAQMHGVRVDWSGIEADTVEIDAEQIQQVLIGLMVNAIEAMSGNRDGSGILHVSLNRQTDHVLIQVSDNGPGMSEDVKEHVFEPFFTTKSEGKGVGLGLAIAYGIMETHHGTIEVKSALGEGTSFILTLPVRQPAEPDLPNAQAAQEGARP